MKMNLTGAIEILKLHKHTTDKFKHSVGDQYVSDAIDTVVSHCEKHTYTADDMEDFVEWLIGRSADWITDEERCETAETFIEMWEKERVEK